MVQIKTYVVLTSNWSHKLEKFKTR